MENYTKIFRFVLVRIMWGNGFNYLTMLSFLYTCGENVMVLHQVSVVPVIVLKLEYLFKFRSKKKLLL